MDIQEHNVEAVIIGTGEFAFCEGATSVADAQAKGYQDVGNVRSIAIQPDKEEFFHYGSYRGSRRKDKKVVTQSELKYLVRLDEFSQKNLLHAFFGSAGTNHTQSSLTAIDGQDLAFGTTPAVIGRWYDILTSAGARVRNLTTVTIATLTENTDFVLDLANGRIRFLTAQSSDLTPVITCPAITAGDAYNMKATIPLGKLSREGFGKMYIYDQSEDGIVAFEHTDFKCEVSINNQPELGADSEIEIELVVEVLTPAGTIYSRE